MRVVEDDRATKVPMACGQLLLLNVEKVRKIDLAERAMKWDHLHSLDGR
jgi:hypothetical protein